MWHFTHVTQYFLMRWMYELLYDRIYIANLYSIIFRENSHYNQQGSNSRYLYPNGLSRRPVSNFKSLKTSFSPPQNIFNICFNTLLDSSCIVVAITFHWVSEINVDHSILTISLLCCLSFWRWRRLQITLMYQVI